MGAVGLSDTGIVAGWASKEMILTTGPMDPLFNKVTSSQRAIWSRGGGLVIGDPSWFGINEELDTISLPNYGNSRASANSHIQSISPNGTMYSYFTSGHLFGDFTSWDPIWRSEEDNICSAAVYPRKSSSPRWSYPKWGAFYKRYQEEVTQFSRPEYSNNQNS